VIFGIPVALVTVSVNNGAMNQRDHRTRQHDRFIKRLLQKAAHPVRVRPLLLAAMRGFPSPARGNTTTRLFSLEVQMRLFASSAAAAVLCVGSSMPAFAGPVQVAVGTKVPMHLVQPLSSGSATAGQTFMAEAAEAVVVGGQTVIMKGAAGRGTVVNVTKAQGKSAGSLTIDFTRVRAVDGSWVQLGHSSSAQGNPEKGKASTATIASTVVLGPLGLFAHNMVKGKDITLDTKQTFPAWVKVSTSVHVP
jgi:hypothetical protein